MENGYIDLLAKKERIYCKKHKVLVAGKCPFCKEHEKKVAERLRAWREQYKLTPQYQEYMRRDCRKKKKLYRLMMRDQVMALRIREQWKISWQYKKDDPVQKEKRRKYSRASYLRNRERQLKRNKELYHIRSKDPVWRRDRAERSRLYRLKIKQIK